MLGITTYFMPYPTIRLVQDWLRVRKQFVESRLCKVKLYVQAGTDPNSYLSTGICTDPYFLWLKSQHWTCVFPQRQGVFSAPKDCISPSQWWVNSPFSP